MGLLPLTGKKRKSGQHGPPRAGADRLAGAKARAINMALSKRPQLAETIALRELGIDQPGEVDPFERFLGQLGKFKAAVPEMREMERPPPLIDWQPLMAAALPLLLAVLGGQQGSAAAASSNGHGPAGSNGHGPAGSTRGPLGAIDQGEAAPAAAEPIEQAAIDQAAAAAAASPVAERRRGEDVPGKASWQAGMAVSLLAGRTPKEAAAQLVAMTGFDVPVVVGWLCRTPDGELMHYLARIGGQQPHLAGLVVWCQLDPEWTIETVRELRLLTGTNPPGPGEPAAAAGPGY